MHLDISIKENYENAAKYKEKKRNEMSERTFSSKTLVCNIIPSLDVCSTTRFSSGLLLLLLFDGLFSEPVSMKLLWWSFLLLLSTKASKCDLVDLLDEMRMTPTGACICCSIVVFLVELVGDNDRDTELLLIRNDVDEPVFRFLRWLSDASTILLVLAPFKE